ncbi:MAG: hypothetical protein LBL62_00365 [Planctomycetaceae bacterium]|nr:hypothetical protein [Planctomycetaceae bacterium]
MKNLVENASENSVKSQMLKWRTMGGEFYREELRNDREKSLLSLYFSAKFLYNSFVLHHSALHWSNFLW